MINRIKKALSVLFNVGQPKYQILTGSRRIIKDFRPEQNGFYGDDSFRYECSKALEPFLRKGEAIYYEIIGYVGSTPIMPAGDNSVLGKEFVRQYGPKSEWTYGCLPGQYKIIIYNWMMSNEEGFHYSYPWEHIQQRCEKYGLIPVETLAKCVLAERDFRDDELGIWYITRESLAKLVEELTEDQPETLSRGSHIREGVCLRVEKEGELKSIYKNKSRSFGILEGYIAADVVNIEEVESYS